MNIVENLPILIDHHPDHQAVNAELVKHIKSKTQPYNGKEIDEWVTSLITKFEFDAGYNIQYTNGWLARYDEGDHIDSHNHHSYHLSYIYFVKAPEGSSPLVFTTSGQEIEAEEGKIVIFPGWMYHHVPYCKVSGRMVRVGNAYIHINN